MYLWKLCSKYDVLPEKTNVCYKTGNIKLTLIRKNAGLPLNHSGIN